MDEHLRPFAPPATTDYARWRRLEGVTTPRADEPPARRTSGLAPLMASLILRRRSRAPR